MCEISLELIIKVQERRQWRRIGVFFVHGERILHIVVFSFSTCKCWLGIYHANSCNTALSAFNTNADLVTFTKKILNGKLHFLCSFCVNHHLIQNSAFFYWTVFDHDYLILRNQSCVAGHPNPNCIEEECKKKHYGYAKCINDVCVPDCVPKVCALQYGVCKNGKCVPTCDEMECAARGGKCFQGVCKIKCCRGTSGPNAVYVAAEDTYYADTCNIPCPYLGTGVP